MSTEERIAAVEEILREEIGPALDMDSNVDLAKTARVIIGRLDEDYDDRMRHSLGID